MINGLWAHSGPATVTLKLKEGKTKFSKKTQFSFELQVGCNFTGMATK